MAQSRYVIGIDLGTTNCALAYGEIDADVSTTNSVAVLSVAQLTNPGEVRDEDLLPSFLYLPGSVDFPAGSIRLPWDSDRDFTVGKLAQKRGAENAGHLVSSAKSWLSYGGVDRTAPLLPFRAPEGVARISPVEASRRYLEHLKEAWDYKFPDALFGHQHVLITIPASFDAVARELTLDAATQAGYEGVTLLEEPQAAFYAWIERHVDWRQRVHLGDLILVVDIGGGTTDFTLIAVTEQDGELTLNRMAVGEHLLLGGDNIDLGLAGTVSQRLADQGTRIDTWQLQQLWNNCRVAKEKLLASGSTSTEETVTILGRGSGLVGGTITATLHREAIDRLLTEGFLSGVSSSDMPARQRRVGVQEIGLPYAADPAITKHLARFLRQQAATSEHGAVRRGASGLACPTHVLFNGGVLSAPVVRERITATLNAWLEEEGFAPVEPLEGDDLMHAVARGAAYYGLARRRQGVRIRGGVARTYYVGIESAMPTVPGIAAPLKALTVVPFGMEEGSEIRIPGQEFGLVVGESAEFRFLTSAVRRNDQPGDLIADFGEDLEELSPVDVAFGTAAEAGVGVGVGVGVGENASEVVPVSFESVVTETGLLQLWCVARDGRRWKLEFNVRERVEP
jgi:molecular chaperone DnaK (HSP70)